jgi:hypothetical protein
VDASKPANGAEPEQEYLYPDYGRLGNIFLIHAQHVLYWPYLGGGYGNAGMRPERRLSGRNGSGRRQPLRQPSCHSGAKAINPRGLGTESPTERRISMKADWIRL